MIESVHTLSTKYEIKIAYVLLHGMILALFELHITYFLRKGSLIIWLLLPINLNTKSIFNKQNENWKYQITNKKLSNKVSNQKSKP